MTEGLIPIYVKQHKPRYPPQPATRCAKEAWFTNAKDARVISVLSILISNLTQGRFLNLIHDLENGQKPDERLNKWQRELWLLTRCYFDDVFTTTPTRKKDLERIMKARKNILLHRRKKQKREPPKQRSRRLLNEYCARVINHSHAAQNGMRIYRSKA